MKQVNSRRYCSNGHVVEDDQLNYCPECGMPLSSDPPEQSNQQNNQNTSSGNYRQNEPPQKQKKPIGYIVLSILVVALVFVILEMADVTNLIPPLHKTGKTTGESTSLSPYGTGENTVITVAPTKEPTEAPTDAPTVAPTKEPTKAPTEVPTETPLPEKAETPEKYFKYTISNNQVTITAYTGKDKDVVIPTYIKGYPVTSIGESAFGNGAAEHIETVVLPETITKIDDYAFHACYNLREINLPEGVISIGINAFGFCPIEIITLPSTVQNMGDGVFWRNGVLKKVTIKNDKTVYQGNPFPGCDALTLNGIILPSGNSKTRKNDGALFSDKTLLYVPKDSNMVSYSIPEGTTRIANSAFEGMTSLSEIWIPDSTTSIGENAFLSCESLKTIHFGSGLKTIEFCAFIYCYSLTEVKLPEGLTAIGQSAFYYCTQLSKITIPSSVRTIEDGAFDETNNLTIYGEKGSTAEKYAKNHNHKFVVNGTAGAGKQKQSIPEKSANGAPLVLGFDLTASELTNKGNGLYKEAVKWTKNSVPQTLDDFPVIPVYIFSLENQVEAIRTSLVKNGKKATWTSSAESLYDGEHGKVSFDRCYGFTTSGSDISFKKTKTNTFQSDSSQNASDVYYIRQERGWTNGDWEYSFMIDFFEADHENGGRITFLEIFNTKTGMDVHWQINSQMNNQINIHVYLNNDGKFFSLDYDINTKKLIGCDYST